MGALKRLTAKQKVNSETGNFRRAPFVSLEEKVVVDDTYDNCSCFIWAALDSNPGFRYCPFYLHPVLTWIIHKKCRYF